MALDQVPRLGCGRPVDEVWTDLDLPPSAHEQSCPFCQQARASLADLSAATQALARQDEERYRPSSRVRASVMGLVRAEVRRGRRIPLVTPEPEAPAELTISEQALVQLVWEIADTIPGVRARRCRVTLDPAPVAPGEATQIDLDLRIAVAADVDILATSDLLRGDIHRTLAARTGLVPRTVSVEVEDVYDV